MDASSAALLTFGVATLAVSWILLMVASWREDYSWGLCTLFLPPLSYLYSLARLDKAGDAIVVAVIGWLFIWFGVG